MNFLSKRKLSDSYRKNKDNVKALVFRDYPKFIYKDTGIIPAGQIPVFALHGVTPEQFELQLVYLTENNYRSLKANEFYEVITGKKNPGEKTVVLTFDDGRGSLWSTAYPLLKKYGLTAISFLVTNAIEDESPYYANLEDVWLGNASLEEIRLRDKILPLCTWKEIKEMHESGVIDFQSHTSFHNSVFNSNKLLGFANPYLQPSFLTSDINPVINRNNTDMVPAKLEFGHPIYKNQPTMSSEKRYIEDEEISKKCIEFVTSKGGEHFFKQPGWNRKLKKYYNLISNESGSKGKLQSKEERFDELYKDLMNAKKIIESRLDNKVEHLCYPWYRGSSLSVKASKAAGYICNYWGLLNNKNINKIGDDPYYVSRLHEDYIFSLPGKGRISVSKQWLSKISRYIFRNEGKE